MKIKTGTSVRDSAITEALKETEQKRSLSIPAGYAEIKLSSKGKLGAPELFHIRNFKVGEVYSLSLTREEDLPPKLIEILNDMILEDVNVAEWHESEVLETMVYVYMTFFSPVMREIYFPVMQEDLDYLEENGRENQAQLIREGKQKPITDVSIVNGVETYDLPENFKSRIKIKNPETGFYCSFSYVKYGDQLLVKEMLQTMYSEQEARFADLVDRIKYNNDVIRNRKNNPLAQTLPLDPVEESAYRDYVNERIQTLSDIVRYISVVDYNGRDVSHLSPSEKYELLSKDPNVDIEMFQVLEEKRQNQQFGIKPIVKMLNPITNQMCERRLAFRLSSLVQTYLISKPHRYVACDDDED